MKDLLLSLKFWSVSLYDHCKNQKCTEWPKTELDPLSVKKTTLYILNIFPRGPNFVRFTLQLGVSKIQGREKSEIHRMIPNWTWIHNNQKYLYTLNTHSRGANIWSVSLYDERFSRYKVAENQKCTEWPQTELEHLIVKSTLYTLNTHPWGLNCGPFCSTTSGFQDIISPETRNALNDPKLNLTVKITLYTLNTYPWRRKFWSVLLYN